MSTSSKSTSEHRWRVFYTHARAEKKCDERLQDAGIESFLPVFSSYNKWADRKKLVIQPLFSNYIFARVDELERLSVLKTDGIVKCVKFGAGFAEISEQEIAQLKLTQAHPERLSTWQYMLPAIGDLITVMKGPMQGLKGQVMDHRGKMYIVVQIDTIRQAIRVQVPAEWVVTTTPEAGAHTV